MNQTPPQIEALLELTWLTIIRTMLIITNHVADAWNTHPYFKGFTNIARLNASGDSDQMFTSVITRSIGTGGQPLTPETIEQGIKQYFREDALAKYRQLPQQLISRCADLALGVTNTDKMAQTLYLFARAHKDIIAPLMVALMKKCAADHAGTPVTVAEVDERFVCAAFKAVGIKRTLPMLLDYEGSVALHIFELLAKNQTPVDEDREQEIEQFTRQVIMAYAQKNLV